VNTKIESSCGELVSGVVHLVNYIVCATKFEDF
jgi:hypothetical protein